MSDAKTLPGKTNFRAFQIMSEAEAGGVRAEYRTMTLDELSRGDVVIRSEYSSVNYKDALAATGAGKIVRRFPLVGGIDVAGKVVASEDPRYSVGDKVLVTGCGLGETRDGGYGELVRVQGDSVIPVPDGLSTRDVMGLGTAGFTAALAISKMEHNGQSSDKGPILVTGATGGVGSFAIDMLAGSGYETVALTSKGNQSAYLRALGASEVLMRDTIDFDCRALESARWAGALDTVGGTTLSWLMSTTKFWGNIASIGLAGGAEIHASVMPFILRGINVLGINSMATPREIRQDVWQRIAGDLRPRHFDQIVQKTISFEELPSVFEDYLQGRVTGRTIVAYD